MDKPDISVIIPTKDDHYLLMGAVSSLKPQEKDIQVIIVDDGSFTKIPPSMFKGMSNVSVVRIDSQRGVGHAFDTGIKKAKADNILLMGSDIIVGKDWDKKVLANTKAHPRAITCVTCVAVSEDDMRWEGKKRSYGATLSVIVPAGNGDILQCEWLRDKKADTSYPVPAILGTCYAVTKRWYKHIGGWGHLKAKWGLNREESKWTAHKIWGGLEPMISLKSWFAGGSCRVDPTWEAAHIFGRKEHVDKNRGSKMNMYYFNKLLSAYTLFSPEEAKILDDSLGKDRSKNLARQYIQRNKKAIELEKMYNDSIKREDFTILQKRFGVDFSMF